MEEKEILYIIKLNPAYAEVLWMWWLHNTKEGVYYYFNETVGKSLKLLNESLKDLRKTVRGWKIETIILG